MGGIGKGHGYPELLEYGVFGIAAEVCQPGFFLDQFILLFARPAHEVERGKFLFVKVEVICGQCFEDSVGKEEFYDANPAPFQINDIVGNLLAGFRRRGCINFIVEF